MISLENFILVNMLMDMLILIAGARGVGHIRWRRMMLAVFTGTAYSVISYSISSSWLRNAWGEIAVFIIMAGIMFPNKEQRRNGLARMIVWAAVMGGIQVVMKKWISSNYGWMAMGSMLYLLLCILNGEALKRTENSTHSVVKIRIKAYTGEAEVNALVDTGNKLREPLSGLPVVIVNESKLADIFETGDSCLMDGKTLVCSRVIRYGTIGGNGEMRCYKPKFVLFKDERGWRMGADVWVAVYPGEISSGIEALAPPSLFTRDE